MRRIRFVLWGLLVACCASCPDAFSRNKKGEDGPRGTKRGIRVRAISSTTADSAGTNWPIWPSLSVNWQKKRVPGWFPSTPCLKNSSAGNPGLPIGFGTGSILPPPGIEKWRSVGSAMSDCVAWSLPDLNRRPADYESAALTS